MRITVTNPWFSSRDTTHEDIKFNIKARTSFL